MRSFGFSVSRSLHAVTGAATRRSVMARSLARVVIELCVISVDEAEAEVPGAGTRIRAEIDTARARVAAEAVDFRIEARVVRPGLEVLTGDDDAGALRPADEPLRKPVGQRKALQH